MRGQGVNPRSQWCCFLGSQTTASTWHSGKLSIFIQQEALGLFWRHLVTPVAYALLPSEETHSLCQNNVCWQKSENKSVDLEGHWVEWHSPERVSGLPHQEESLRWELWLYKKPMREDAECLPCCRYARDEKAKTTFCYKPISLETGHAKTFGTVVWPGDTTLSVLEERWREIGVRLCTHSNWGPDKKQLAHSRSNLKKNV